MAKKTPKTPKTKRDTTAKIAAELWELLHNGLEDDLYASISELADRVATLKPGPVRGWYRAWYWKDGEWWADGAAYEMNGKPKGNNTLVWRPFDLSDTGPKHPPKE